MTVTLLDGDLNPEWLDSAIGTRYVGVDIETNGLDYKRHQIATFQMFVPEKGTVMVRHFDAVPLNIIRLLESKQTTKIFHHAPFDLRFLVHNFDLYPERIACTKVAADILDPKREAFTHPITLKGSHSLIALVQHFFGFTLDKSLTVSDWFAETLSPELLDYAAKDVEYLPLLLRRLETMLAKVGKVKLARKAMAALPTNIVLEVKEYTMVYSY